MSTLNALRARIASMERQLPDGGLSAMGYARPGLGGLTRAFCFGLEALDSRFSLGGLSFGSHQITRAPGGDAAALMFAISMTVRRFKADAGAQALVIQEKVAAGESGGLYGPGLKALGLDPGRLAFVTAHDGAQALRMLDEAVRSGAVSVVIAELDRAARRIDLAATQRFNLYAQQTSTLVLLVTPDLKGTSAAMTRWRARTAPSQAPRRYLGPPALDLELTRNRFGPVGRFNVEWSSDDEAFRNRTPLRPPLVRPSVDRSDPAVTAAQLSAGLGGDVQDRLAAHGGR